MLLFFREPDIPDGSGELHDKKGLPIYSRDSKLWSTRKCFSSLLNSNLDNSKVCIIVPFSVDINSVFIVDLNQLGSNKDIFCDDMGVWQWSGSYRKWCKTNEKGDVAILEGKSDAEDSQFCYCIWKRYYCLKSNPDIKRMVVMMEGMLV